MEKDPRDPTPVEARFAQDEFVSRAGPLRGQKIMDIDAGYGNILALLVGHVERAGQMLPERQGSILTHLPSQAGTFVGLCATQAKEQASVILCRLRQTNSILKISTCQAGTAAQDLIDHDNRVHAEALMCGEARIYMTTWATFTDEEVLAHLAQKVRDGPGYDLITAHRWLSDIPTSEHAETLRRWSSALAPGGCLVVGRALHYPNVAHTAWPGRLVFISRGGGSDRGVVHSHHKSAPDSCWDECEMQLRQLAAEADLAVVSVSRACHGELRDGDAGRYHSIGDEEWRKLVPDAPPGVEQHHVTARAVKARVEDLERRFAHEGRREVQKSPVAVIAMLRKRD